MHMSISFDFGFGDRTAVRTRVMILTHPAENTI